MAEAEAVTPGEARQQLCLAAAPEAAEAEAEALTPREARQLRLAAAAEATYYL